MELPAAVDNVRDLCPPRQNWNIIVRVIRMWSAALSDGTHYPSSLEMILLDQHGEKIQASLRKSLYHRWANKIVEGMVYKITFFHLLGNLGSYRTTAHAYRLLFIGKTEVLPCQSNLISRWGLSLKTSEIVHSADVQADYLVDMVALLTASSVEKPYIKDGKAFKSMKLELTDDRGKVDFIVFNEYVNVVSDYLSSHSSGHLILVIELAKIKTFKGTNVLQSVPGATRIRFNPDNVDVNTFMDRIRPSGSGTNRLFKIIGNGSDAVPMSDDVIKMHPRKDITSLKGCKEDGIFIVKAKIISLLHDDMWWYNACRCNKAVISDYGVCYCPGCMKHVVDVVPRYKIKVEVFDEIESAIFIMFDSDVQYLLNVPCKEMLAYVKDPNDPVCSPEMEEMLVGKELVFKVEKKCDSLVHFHDSYCVKGLCDDVDMMGSFKGSASTATHVKAKFRTPFTVMNLDHDDSQLAIKDGDDCMSSHLVTCFVAQSKFIGSPTDKLDEVDDVVDNLVNLNSTSSVSTSASSMIGSSSKSLKRKVENEFEDKDSVLKVKTAEVKKEKM